MGSRSAAICADGRRTEAIKSAGNRRLLLQAYTRSGEMVEFVEQFVLGVGVTHPLLSFGRLLRQGWALVISMVYTWSTPSRRCRSRPDLKETLWSWM